MSARPKTGKFDVYQAVTDQIVAALEEGTVPWRQPWRSLAGDLPRNLVSGKPYRGINLLLLGMSKYESPYWLTYKQAKEKGGNVRKGEKSTMIIFWKIMQGTDKETGERISFPLLRYYNVFNADQCDGLKVPEREALPEYEPIAELESLLYGMPNPPKIEHGGNAAAYAPYFDTVKMPVRGAFVSIEAYYQTLAHELTHATGHKDRLNRDEIQNIKSMESESYSREELVAELGAAMLLTLAGVEFNVESSAAYIEHWLGKLKADPKLIVTAASKAMHAADYIVGEKAETVETETPALVAA